MKAIIGQKIEMTQIFTPEGVVLPVTKIKAEPVTVTQIKTKDKDGYTAVQIASGVKRKVTKPLMGHFHGAKYRFVKEFQIESDDLKVGDSWGVNIFTDGEKVKVVGTSKGKGFQGVVKRWNFRGSPASHGHKDQLRMPGSIGATGPAHVFKGMRMGGHMGTDQITSKWLEIVKIDEAENILYVKGSVPGSRNGILYIMTDTEFKLPVQEVKEEKVKEVEEFKEDSVEKTKEEISAVEVKEEATKEEVPAEKVKEDTPAEIKEKASEEEKKKEVVEDKPEEVKEDNK